MAPIWHELWVANQDDINIAKVDCTDPASKILCEQFEIRGYPTLKLLKDDQFYNYRGPRALQELRDFMFDGYITAAEEHQGELPKRLVGMDKLKKQASDLVSSLEQGCDQLFDKAHL